MADPVVVLYAVVGALHLAFAGMLLGLNFGDRLNRAFALYLVLLGGAMVVYGVPGDAAWQAGLRGLFWYLNLGSAFPLLYLAACYRDRFGRGGLRRVALPVLVVGAVLVETLFLYDPGLVLGAGFRPLKALHFALILLGPGLLAGLLAREALGSGAEVRRRHLLMASLGFAFYPTAFGLHLFVPNLMNVPAVEAWIGALGLVPVLYVVWQFARAARPVAGEGLRSSARKYLGILSLSPISVVGLAVAEATLPLDEARASMRWVMTLWLVVLLLLVGYAILRHQLFGIELGVKWTLRRGTVPALLVAAFFVVTELTQNFASALGGVWTWVVAGGVVGVIAIGYLPLQRAANRLAEAAMPEVGNTPRYTSLRRRQLYGSALAAAWEDGFLTRVERLRLDRLRERLQLTAQDAGSLESEFVERRVGTGPKR